MPVITAFDNHLKILSISLSFVDIFKKDMKQLLPTSPQLAEDNCVSWIVK